MRIAPVLSTLSVLAALGLSSASLSGSKRSGNVLPDHQDASLKYRRAHTISGGDMTFYTGGQLSAPSCGGEKPTDESMAIAVPKGSPAKCGDWVHISYKGKHTAAKVVDTCGGCANEQSIDATKAVFKQLASLDEGRLKDFEMHILG